MDIRKVIDLIGNRLKNFSNDLTNGKNKIIYLNFKIYMNNQINFKPIGL